MPASARRVPQHVNAFVLPLLAGAVLLLSGTASAASPMDMPLQVRNTGPIAGIFGLPRPQGGSVATGHVQWSVGADYGNTFSESRRGADVATLDGETMVTFLTLRGPLARSWEWGVEVPYVDHRPSHLDGFIDDFHDAFGFPDGGRSRVPRGRLDYRIQVDGSNVARVDDARSGLGDVRLWVGRSLYASQDRAGSVRVQVKLPTGDAGDLTGSEAADVALWWEHDERRLFGAQWLSLSAMLGAARLGDGELLRRRQNPVVGLASLGLRARLAPRLQLNLQADAHGAPFDVDLGELGDDGIQGTIGGRILLSETLWLDLGVVENLESRSSPDAVFLLHLSGRW